MFIREETFHTIIQCFKRHGALPIDTPVFELKDVLTDKYGEDSKLIYDLADQGEGEKLALRYDLTVPFARYVATHGLKHMKRYHLGKVYRRDEPYMTKGRYREFWQCDYDIAGTYDPMLPDADCLKLASEVLTELDVGKFTIRLSHRKILDGIFEISKVPESLFRPISSAVDKLDKKTWEEVKEEMIQKGITGPVADKIGTYVLTSGSPKEVLAKLKIDKELTSNQSAKKGIDDLALLFSYLEVMEGLQFISFDLSLARGLDYYTGVIFEAIHLSEEAKGIGSILGGGRYDDLVGKFSSHQVPSVGFSVGIERILAEKKKQKTVQETCTKILVAGVGVPVEERLKLCCELWQANIPTEFVYEVEPRVAKQFEKANSSAIPWVLTIGEEELSQGKVSIKNMITGQQEIVKRGELIGTMKILMKMKKKDKV